MLRGRLAGGAARAGERNGRGHVYAPPSRKSVVGDFERLGNTLGESRFRDGPGPADGHHAVERPFGDRFLPSALIAEITAVVG